MSSPGRLELATLDLYDLIESADLGPTGGSEEDPALLDAARRAEARERRRAARAELAELWRMVGGEDAESSEDDGAGDAGATEGAEAEDAEIGEDAGAGDAGGAEDADVAECAEAEGAEGAEDADSAWAAARALAVAVEAAAAGAEAAAAEAAVIAAAIEAEAGAAPLKAEAGTEAGGGGAVGARTEAGDVGPEDCSDAGSEDSGPEDSSDAGPEDDGGEAREGSTDADADADAEAEAGTGAGTRTKAAPRKAGAGPGAPRGRAPGPPAPSPPETAPPPPRRQRGRATGARAGYAAAPRDGPPPLEGPLLTPSGEAWPGSAPPPPGRVRFGGAGDTREGLWDCPEIREAAARYAAAAGPAAVFVPEMGDAGKQYAALVDLVYARRDAMAWLQSAKLAGPDLQLARLLQRRVQGCRGHSSFITGSVTAPLPPVGDAMAAQNALWALPHVAACVAMSRRYDCDQKLFLLQSLRRAYAPMAYPEAGAGGSGARAALAELRAVLAGRAAPAPLPPASTARAARERLRELADRCAVACREALEAARRAAAAAGLPVLSAAAGRGLPAAACAPDALAAHPERVLRAAELLGAARDAVERARLQRAAPAALRAEAAAALEAAALAARTVAPLARYSTRGAAARASAWALARALFSPPAEVPARLAAALAALEAAGGGAGAGAAAPGRGPVEVEVEDMRAGAPRADPEDGSEAEDEEAEEDGEDEEAEEEEEEEEEEKGRPGPAALPPPGPREGRRAEEEEEEEEGDGDGDGDGDGEAAAGRAAAGGPSGEDSGPEGAGDATALRRREAPRRKRKSAGAPAGAAGPAPAKSRRADAAGPARREPPLPARVLGPMPPGGPAADGGFRRVPPGDYHTPAPSAAALAAYCRPEVAARLADHPLFPEPWRPALAFDPEALAEIAARRRAGPAGALAASAPLRRRVAWMSQIADPEDVRVVVLYDPLPGEALAAPPGEDERRRPEWPPRRGGLSHALAALGNRLLLSADSHAWAGRWTGAPDVSALGAQGVLLLSTRDLAFRGAVEYLCARLAAARRRLIVLDAVDPENWPRDGPAVGQAHVYLRAAVLPAAQCAARWPERRALARAVLASRRVFGPGAFARAEAAYARLYPEAPPLRLCRGGNVRYTVATRLGPRTAVPVPPREYRQRVLPALDGRKDMAAQGAALGLGEPDFVEGEAASHRAANRWGLGAPLRPVYLACGRRALELAPDELPAAAVAFCAAALPEPRAEAPPLVLEAAAAPPAAAAPGVDWDADQGPRETLVLLRRAAGGGLVERVPPPAAEAPPARVPAQSSPGAGSGFPAPAGGGRRPRRPRHGPPPRVEVLSSSSSASSSAASSPASSDDDEAGAAGGGPASP
ncbi:transcriptional regulator ICP4 [bovine alphaherpesvirus 1]|nr:transcriptional regulator ICP4 [Bovine alphaherpesvirus 1]QBH74800.1 transcriptional regulator ICP4 [Bovine alphaherpesvirus 1]QBH75153.1 transcriptional regulator ICP4 [Bovine alphaherpesvirus 1]QBH75162.1 transcriptional regulator ICP4 [Bovine alphaherpesvirus 1]